MRGCFLLGLFIVGCGRVSFDEPRSDAAMMDSGGTDGAATRTWGVPIVHSELAGGGVDEDPSVTSDRLLIVWSSNRPGTGEHDLWLATRTTPTGPFSGLEELAGLNSGAMEVSPELSPDGLELFFVSNVSGDEEIYRSERATRTSPWGPPVLRTDLSSDVRDFEVAISPDGLTAVVNRSSNFYELTRGDTSSPFGDEMARPELRILNNIASPTIDNDARTIYFHAGTVRDLYVARRSSSGTFSMPVAVIELATDLREADPFMAADERYLFFNCEDSVCEVERQP